jgi:hypothetical protein
MITFAATMSRKTHRSVWEYADFFHFLPWAPQNETLILHAGWSERLFLAEFPSTHINSQGACKDILTE